MGEGGKIRNSVSVIPKTTKSLENFSRIEMSLFVLSALMYPLFYSLLHGVYQIETIFVPL